eukprot:6091241-Pyramimonas_sp.AAC.1
MWEECGTERSGAQAERSPAPPPGQASSPSGISSLRTWGQRRENATFSQRAILQESYGVTGDQLHQDKTSSAYFDSPEGRTQSAWIPGIFERIAISKSGLKERDSMRKVSSYHGGDSKIGAAQHVLLEVLVNTCGRFLVAEHMSGGLEVRAENVVTSNDVLVR